MILPNWLAPANIRALTTTRHTDIQNLNLPSKLILLNQVHGNNIVIADEVHENTEADGSYTEKPNIICVIKTADCLPILICDKQGTCVAAIHAGWRSLASHIIESSIEKIPVLPENILAWLGPAIGPDQFEVGEDVYTQFPDNQTAFKKIADHQYLCNIYLLARQKLEKLGVKNIYGGKECTYSDAERFYSYRRSKDIGRMLSLIWMVQ